jgi:hypothetical protein
VRRKFCVVAAGIGALCGIWANCKSFLLAPPRRAARVNSPCVDWMRMKVMRQSVRMLRLDEQRSRSEVPA